MSRTNVVTLPGLGLERWARVLGVDPLEAEVTLAQLVASGVLVRIEYRGSVSWSTPSPAMRDGWPR